MSEEHHQSLIDVADIRDGKLHTEALGSPYGPNRKRREHIRSGRGRGYEVGIEHGQPRRRQDLPVDPRLERTEGLLSLPRSYEVPGPQQLGAPLFAQPDASHENPVDDEQTELEFLEALGSRPAAGLKAQEVKLTIGERVSSAGSPEQVGIGFAEPHRTIGLRIRDVEEGHLRDQREIPLPAQR
jgi:hypothetical protein